MLDTGVWAISSLVGKDPSIRGFADLKGKRIAMPFPGSPLDFQSRTLLSFEKIDPDKDVSISFGPFAQSVQRLLAGQLDAAALPEPLATLVVRKNGLLRLVEYSQAWARFTGGDRQSPQVSLFATEGWARDHADLISPVISAWDAASRAVTAAPGPAAAAFAKALDVRTGNPGGGNAQHDSHRPFSGGEQDARAGLLPGRLEVLPGRTASPGRAVLLRSVGNALAALRAQKLRLRLLGAAGVLLLLAGWAAASIATGSFFVPAPWTTAADTALLLARAASWNQILITFLRVCTGFVVGYAAGIAAGMAIGARREIAALLKPLVLFFQGMPPLLWAIPLVALMGIGHLPTIIVITLITFPLVAVTIGEGMTTLPRDLGEMLAIFAPGFSARTRELVLPHLAPFLGAAVNTGLVLAVKASVTAEYFGANDGIGFQIQSAYMSLRIRSLFSWAAVLILLILLFNWLLPRIRQGRSPASAAGSRPRSGCLRGGGRGRAEARSCGPSPHTRHRPERGELLGYRHHGAVLQDLDLTVRPGRSRSSRGSPASARQPC